MTTTLLLETASLTALVALVAVLAARTVLTERGTGVPRTPGVRRLDVAGVVLSVLCVGFLVTTVVVGVLAGV